MMDKARPSIGQRIKSLWAKFSDPDFRSEFSASRIGDALAYQIHEMRAARGWTQEDLAQKADMKQPRISKLEESCSGASMATLKKLALAFDVALEVQFIPFSRLAEKVVAHSAVGDVTPFEKDGLDCIKDYDAVLSGAATVFARRVVSPTDYHNPNRGQSYFDRSGTTTSEFTMSAVMLGPVTKFSGRSNSAVRHQELVG